MIKKAAITLIVCVMALGTLTVIAAPAFAQGFVSANCAVSLFNRAPRINCLSVTGGEARARADCTFAPDTYTRWRRSFQSDIGTQCLFAARGAILETRAF